MEGKRPMQVSIRLPSFVSDIIEARRLVKAYRDTIGTDYDATSVIWPDQSLRLIKMGLQKTLPPKVDYKSLIDRYSGWAYICASRNASAVASVPLRLYASRATGQEKAGRGIRHIGKSVSKAEFNRLQKRYPRHKGLRQAVEVEEILEHPMLDLLQNVNSTSNRFDSVELTSTFIDCLGNAYWYVPRDTMGVPRELWVLMAHWMFVVPDEKKVVKGYLYGLDRKTQTAFEPQDIIHFRTPNPLSQFYGMGCIEAAAYAVDRSRAMDVYEQSLNENMGIPAVWVQYKTGQLDEKKRRELEAQWNSRFKGVKRAGKVGVTDSEYDIKEIGIKPREMGFSEGRKWTRLEIADAFGVPVALLDTENVNLANAKTALYQYFRFTVTPRLRRFEEKLNERLVPMYDEPRLFLAFDNCVPADDEFELRQDQAMLQSYVITINEVRAKHSLDPVPWGDVPYTPVQNITPSEGTEEDGSDEDDEMTERKVYRVKSLPNTSDPAAIFNALLAGEYRAAYVYFSTAQIVEGPSRTVISQEYTTHSAEELGHAAMLIERMQELRLEVVTSMEQIISLAPSGYLPKDSGATVILNEQLEAEADEDYTRAISLLGMKDPVTALLLTRILTVERQHRHDLEMLRSELSGVKIMPHVHRLSLKAAGEGHVEPMTTNQKRLAKSLRAVFTMQEAATVKWMQDHRAVFAKGVQLADSVLGDEWDAIMAKMCHEPIDREYRHGARTALGKLRKNSKAVSAIRRKKPEVMADLSDAWIDRPEMGQYVRAHTMKFAKAINKRTHDDLRQILGDGLDAGKGFDEIRDEIGDLFAGYENYRVDRIARTESARAVVGGERQTYKDSGVVDKLTWLASADACEFCLSINGKTIGVDDVFFRQGDSISVGIKTMDFDYSDIEGPPLHPNCRCDVLPEVSNEEEG